MTCSLFRLVPRVCSPHVNITPVQQVVPSIDVTEDKFITPRGVIFCKIVKGYHCNHIIIPVTWYDFYQIPGISSLAFQLKNLLLQWHHKRKHIWSTKIISSLIQVSHFLNSTASSLVQQVSGAVQTHLEVVQ